MSKAEFDDLSNLSKDWLRDRLEDAVKTLWSLPPAIKAPVLGMYDIMRVEREPDPDEVALFNRFVANSIDIRRMDEVFAWMRHMPGDRHQRYLFNQVLFYRSVIKGDRPLSWRKIGKMLSIPKSTAHEKYEHALLELNYIVAKIRDGKLDPNSKVKTIIREG